MGKRGPKPMSLDLESILERIEAGDSQTEIAQSLGIGIATLSRFLNSDENAEKSARARSYSAEAWLDKGLDAVFKAMDKDGRIDASAARAYAQECARRAAIRNPQYRDKVDQTISGPNGGPVQFQAIERTIVDPKA